jgi:uncharacterized membrane protein YfcA
MSTPLLELLVVFGSAFIAALLQSLAGFGYGIVAVPLLSLATDVRTASVVLALSSFTLNAYLVLRLRKALRLRQLLPVLLSAVLGVPLGLLFLTSVDGRILAKALGALLLLYVVWSILPIKRPTHPMHRYRYGVPLGLASGALAGAYAMGGPPLVIYVTSQGYDHERHVATVQLMLAVSGAVRVGAVFATGLVSSVTELWSTLTAVGGVIAAASLVLLIRPQVSRTKLRVIVLSIVAIAAIRYLLFA